MSEYFKKFSSIFLVVFMLLLVGCATAPPKHPENTCKIFYQYPDWYDAAWKAQQKWKVPISVMMAIMYHESGYKAKAKPPRTKILWVIPWKRPSSAYGYSQAVDGTWENYKNSTNSIFVARTHFDDACDFIGWYIDQAHRQLGIQKTDAFHLYLAYHEGFKGYARGSYKNKKWLINYAHKVQKRADTYHKQLQKC